MNNNSSYFRRPLCWGACAALARAPAVPARVPARPCARARVPARPCAHAGGLCARAGGLCARAALARERTVTERGGRERRMGGRGDGGGDGRMWRGWGRGGRGWTGAGRTGWKQATRPGNPAPPPSPKTRSRQIITISSPCNRDDAHADRQTDMWKEPGLKAVA
jgi:hypothetical protein